MMPPTEQLAKLIRKKHQLLVQLRDIGRRQANLVGAGEIGELLQLLAGKQRLIAGLQSLERELKPYYAQDPDSRDWPSTAARAECAQLANECNAILEETVALEKLGAEQMDARRNDVARQLQHVHTAAHVRGAYQSQR